MSGKKSLQERLEAATKRWWFWLIVVLIQFVPPITTFPYDPSRTSEVIGNILGSAYAMQWVSLYPVMNLLAIIMVAGVFVFRNRWRRPFALYAGTAYMIYAFLQNVAHFRNGYGVVSNNVVMFVLVGLVWFLEAGSLRNDFRSMRFSIWRVWTIPLAVVAFWYPLRLSTMMPDFNPMNALFGPAGMAFCLMTPAFLTILALCYPHTNVVTLRVTGVFGVIIALYNLIFFSMYWEQLWWNGVLHSPLFLISLYAVILGFKRRPAKEETYASPIERPVTQDL